MVILKIYQIPFHAVVVLGPEHDFLFKSTSTYCVLQFAVYLKTLLTKLSMAWSLIRPSYTDGTSFSP